MNEQEQEEKRVAAAFNAGYLMEKYEPELFEKICTDANKENEFVMYMEQGGRQYRKEEMIQRQKAVQQRQQENKQKRGR